MDSGFVEAFLKTIDCYVMGSRTYETALNFEAKGFGWAYGDKPTFVLTHRELPRIRDTVEFYSGDLAPFVNERLQPRFRSIWFVGGGAVSGECLRLGLADEVRYSVLPILIGDGIPFFDKLERDIALHLAEVNAYKSGTVELRYEVRGRRGESPHADLTTRPHTSFPVVSTAAPDQNRTAHLLSTPVIASFCHALCATARFTFRPPADRCSSSQCRTLRPSTPRAQP